MTIFRPKVSVPAGDSRIIEVKVVGEGNQIVSLAGAEIRWALAALPTSEAALLVKTIGSGIDVPDPSLGVFRILLGAGDTERPAGEYFHQARITFADGAVVTLLGDYLTISETF